MNDNTSNPLVIDYHNSTLLEAAKQNTNINTSARPNIDSKVASPDTYPISTNKEETAVDNEPATNEGPNVIPIQGDKGSILTKTSAWMNALYYEKPRVFEVRSIPVPDISRSEVLLKVICSGICGTDKHLHEGSFLGKFPLIPGHEVVGTIAKLGENVTGLSIGDRCAADPTTSCNTCFQCQRGNTHLCKKRFCRGLNFQGGCAEYVSFPATQVYKIHSLTDEQASLVEPMSCVVHAMDKLSYTAGAEVLVLGAGPSGLLFSQLLKVNGAIKVVLASNKGRKMGIARRIQAADEFVEFERDPENKESAALQLSKLLKAKYPLGFDIVIEATGSIEILNVAIYHVRRGGSLLMYGLYPSGCIVQWPAAYIFFEEIQVVTSIGQCRSFARAIAYLESGRIRTEGIVTDVHTIHEYQQVLDKLKSRNTCKIVVRPS